MKVVLGSTVTNRPLYLKEVIDSYRNTRGIENVIYQPNLEPVNDECRKLIYAIDFMEVRPYTNRAVLGPNANTHRSLVRAFEESDFVIFSEDDVKWAPDTLEYFLWAELKYRYDKSVFDIGAWCTYEWIDKWKYLPPAENFYNVTRRAHYCPTGWATWIDRWKEPNGMQDHTDFASHEGYDFTIQRIRGDRDEIFPILSRTQHIGIYGYHTVGEDHFVKEATNKIWAGSIASPNDDTWKEVF